ncbi:MAG: GatB/YqeY domain-containing protein [Chitinophagaceae bacterium]
MALEQTIMAEMKKAMLAKDEKTLRGVRAIKAAIINAKTAEGAGGELKEEDEIKMLQKLVKQRRDSLAIFQQQNREDLATKEQEEIEVIEQYLPKQLDLDAVRAKVQEIIASSGAKGMADMGKVIGLANKEMAGVADGKTISGMVKELLAKI